jgi:hypothetical protein
MLYLYIVTIIIVSVVMIGLLISTFHYSNKQSNTINILKEENRMLSHKLMRYTERDIFEYVESLKLLSILQYSIFVDVADEDRKILIEYYNEMVRKIAGKINVDWNNSYVEVGTLDIKQVGGNHAE